MKRWVWALACSVLGFAVFVLVVDGNTDSSAGFAWPGGSPAAAVGLAVLTIGVNFVLWSFVGGLRLVSDALTIKNGLGGSATAYPSPSWAERVARPQTPTDVAVLIPAHNEERVIADSIASVARLLPMANIYVVSDGSSDQTAGVARMAQANVLELVQNRGKAGALEAAIEHFDLRHRYRAVLFLDADSQLDEEYLTAGLPLFNDPEVVAVAGFAVTRWEPKELSLIGQLIIAYRDRLYTMQQLFYKFGQSWKWLNVAYIVPGFASMYRSDVLGKITLNPPGLIIEDFNMTFQLHRHRLGRIAFLPAVRAFTQDPHNLGDYVSQIRRWTLGFWQTVRYNGVWLSLFWWALSLVILEVMISSVVILTVPAAAMVLGLPGLTQGAVLSWIWFAELYRWLSSYFSLPALLLVVFVPDYLLTCGLALARKRPRYLLLGLGFLPLRCLDAAMALWTLPRAWMTQSNGTWKSPTRR